MKVLVAQMCWTLCDPMDCSLLGFFVHGILQARIQEWVAIPFSRGSSRPRDLSWVSCIGRQILYPLSHQGSHSMAKDAGKAVSVPSSAHSSLWLLCLSHPLLCTTGTEPVSQAPLLIGFHVDPANGRC